MRPPPALSVSGPSAALSGAFCVGGHCALSVRALHSLCQGPAALCVGPRRLSLSVSGPVSSPRVCGPPAQIPMSPIWFAVDSDAHPHRLRSACHPSVPPPTHLRATDPFRQPHPVSSDPRATHPARHVGLRRFLSGPSGIGSGALCVGAGRSLCRGPALFVSGPALRVSGPNTLCAGARHGERRSLFRGLSFQALSVRVCVGASQCSTALSVPGPGGFCGARHSSALFVLGHALRRSLCVGSRRSVSGSASGPGGTLLCRVPVLFVSGPSAVSVGFSGLYVGPGALCVGARRSLCRGPALCVGNALCVGARRFVSGPGAPCVGAQRSLSGSTSGPGAPFPRLSLSGPGVLCVGPRRFLSGPGAPYVGARRSVCRAPTICVSGPGALCVGAQRSVLGVWRSLCRCVGAQCGDGSVNPSGPAAPSSIRMPSMLPSSARASGDAHLRSPRPSKTA